MTNASASFQTLGGIEDTSLVANSFGFLRSPLCFQPYEADADVAITGVPFDMATSGRRLSALLAHNWIGSIAATHGTFA